MAKDCCDSGCSTNQLITPRYRKILWIALIINLAMFVVEIVSGWNANSVSLLADAIDFFGDAMNYGISLAVLSMSLMWRARAALFKGFTMGAFGIFVLASAVWSYMNGQVPEPYTMGAIGLLALIANVSVAVMLYAYREGDANMRSVWLCSRNDAIGNVAVMIAALGVFGSGSAWPDLLVAAIMASLGLSAAVQVIKKAMSEILTNK
ncbi:MAG: cation diffusion facilitator family transporter [Methylotenera sp.]|jgi:cation diffusion facilitator family transporter|uniref:cation transporter n=1 Tax=Methylotenera sp. L2L1 TaxID=1502770 RepID=UPI00056CA8FA|nr:cation diffusion facilitator family transporter [Methylotenera sp. L2L1]MDP2102794.1 cation diffusion facilitator family transporter [Methylotenera sp.]HQN65056.1 cation diffusion facilitator family transporter [Methylophilus sp.]MDP2282156.1 cation diffusion facilitator family transporter [Methylotenera sp.]MDP3061538.1 cation diffusion facilitator family transporter [Methylotenera sp.]HOY86687.1 cation diffusion facilitator family transporter [Methylotenera sp.]